MLNPITLIDGYKLDHRRQYPAGTEYVYSNFTPRGSRVPGQEEIVFFGLQYFLKRYLMDEFDTFFRKSSAGVVDHYARTTKRYLGPNSIGTEHIRALHQLKYLPLEFAAYPEGSAVPLRVPAVVFQNTHPDFAWLVNYLETLISSVLWLPCTSATTAQRFRRVLQEHATRTGGSQEFVDWQGHDFSFRGMCGPEAAALSGAAHLLFFCGTDTLPALDLIDHYYHTTQEPLGMSVPATEHSVMCAGGKESELETFRRLLALYPAGVVSVVSDTWDLWKVLTETLPELKAEIMARNGKLVIRPDSGDPVKIICGDPEAPEEHPARRGVVRLLHDVFGGTKNSQGFITLDPHIGTIYGDSIDHDRAHRILEGLRCNGFASDNIVLGLGSYSYQYVTRDTYNWAVKATWAQIGGVGHNLSKDPVTDSGMKKSAVGRLAVLPALGEPDRLVCEAPPELEAISLLQPVWRDGEFVRRPENFADIRRRAQKTVGHEY